MLPVKSITDKSTSDFHISALYSVLNHTGRWSLFPQQVYFMWIETIQKQSREANVC